MEQFHWPLFFPLYIPEKIRKLFFAFTFHDPFHVLLYAYSSNFTYTHTSVCLHHEWLSTCLKVHASALASSSSSYAAAAAAAAVPVVIEWSGEGGSKKFTHIQTKFSLTLTQLGSRLLRSTLPDLRAQCVCLERNTYRSPSQLKREVLHGTLAHRCSRIWKDIQWKNIRKKFVV